jgi:glycosyltransferase involved in cell wall biosynthesis
VTKIVFVTQRVDPDDPDLGAATSLVRALAARVDEVAVLALDGDASVLPPNAHLRTFGGANRIARGIRFTVALDRELRSRPLAVVAHMSPIYAVLAAPLARPRGVQVVLWFTHWRRSRLLAAAVRACNTVVSVEPGSFPIATPKLRPIGHGIDLSDFPCVDRSDHRPPLRVVSLGRTSPAKGLDTIVEGVRLARERGLDVELELRGPSVTAEEREHRDRLGIVKPPLPRSEIPALLGRSDVLVNNMRAGAPDKAVYEACATCLPVLASNPSLADVLGEELRFARESPEELADRLEWLAGLTLEQRADIGRRLRARVEASHSTDTWADGLLAAAEDGAVVRSTKVR